MVWIIALLFATIATGRATTYSFAGPGTIQIQQFDPSLGTLEYATITYQQSWTITLDTGEGGYGPSEPATGGGGDFAVAGLFYGDAFVSEEPIATGSIYYPPDEALTIGASIIYGGFDGFLAGTPTADAMTGTGTVSWTSQVDVVWSWDCACVGSESFISATEGLVMVDYVYIPEPGTYALTLLGVEALALGVRRRRLK